MALMSKICCYCAVSVGLGQWLPSSVASYRTICWILTGHLYLFHKNTHLLLYCTCMQETISHSKTLICIQLQMPLHPTCMVYDYGRKCQKSNHGNIHGRQQITDSKQKIIVQTNNQSINQSKCLCHLHKDNQPRQIMLSYKTNSQV